MLADGTVFEGRGLGATGTAVGEVCFNTALTGYQEILTDPSYAGQIVTFTFPHIGNVGTNDEDIEDSSDARAAPRRCRSAPISPSPPTTARPQPPRRLAEAPRHRRAWRASTPGALTALIRDKGMPNARHRACRRRRASTSTT